MHRKILAEVRATGILLLAVDTPVRIPHDDQQHLQVIEDTLGILVILIGQRFEQQNRRIHAGKFVAADPGKQQNRNLQARRFAEGFQGFFRIIEHLLADHLIAARLA